MNAKSSNRSPKRDGSVARQSKQNLLFFRTSSDAKRLHDCLPP